MPLRTILGLNTSTALNQVSDCIQLARSDANELAVITTVVRFR